MSWSKHDNCYICDDPNTQTHHLLDRSQFPQYKHKDWNKVELCYRCHKRVTLDRAKKVDLRKKILPHWVKDKISNSYLTKH
jgi:5-methylcytosine-specific restriction endonuclease McrA